MSEEIKEIFADYARDSWERGIAAAEAGWNAMQDVEHVVDLGPFETYVPYIEEATSFMGRYDRKEFMKGAEEYWNEF